MDESRERRDVLAIIGAVLTLIVFVYYLFRFALQVLIGRESFAVGYGASAVLVASLLGLRLGPKRSFVPFYVYGSYLGLRFLAMDSRQEMTSVSFFQYFVPMAFFVIGYCIWRAGYFEIVVSTLLVGITASLLFGQANHYFGFADSLFRELRYDLIMSGSDIVRRAYSLAGYSLGTGFLAMTGVTLALLRSRWQQFILFPLLLLALFNSYSRAAVGMLFIGTCMWLILPVHRPRHSQISRSIGVVLAGLLFLVGAFLVQASFPQFISSYVSRFVIGLIDLNEGGNLMRIVSWQYALDIWRQSPLVGVGFGALGGSVVARGIAALAPESMYLKVLGELGIVGLLLYASAVFMPVIRAIVQLARRESTPPNRLAGVLVAFATAALIGGLFLQNLESDFMASLFWLVIGGLAAFGDGVVGSRRATDQLHRAGRLGT